MQESLAQPHGRHQEEDAVAEGGDGPAQGHYPELRGRDALPHRPRRTGRHRHPRLRQKMRQTRVRIRRDERQADEGACRPGGEGEEPEGGGERRGGPLPAHHAHGGGGQEVGAVAGGHGHQAGAVLQGGGRRPQEGEDGGEQVHEQRGDAGGAGQEPAPDEQDGDGQRVEAGRAEPEAGRAGGRAEASH